jgi:hypothetical protein
MMNFRLLFFRPDGFASVFRAKIKAKAIIFGAKLPKRLDPGEAI